MSREVRAHVVRLIAWEIGRAAGQEAIASVRCTPTEPVDMNAWGTVRDSLADAWDWWGEGVHLRPQLVQRGGRHREYGMGNPLVFEIIEGLCAKPLDPKSFRPVRTVTIDAHLGDGLLLLAQAVHIGMLEQQNYPGAANLQGYMASASNVRTRRYQCRVQAGNQEWMLFAPSGSSIRYLDLYIHRIMSAGGGPASPFLLKHAHLGHVAFFGIGFWRADLSGADLQPSQPHPSQPPRSQPHRSQPRRSRPHRSLPPRSQPHRSLPPRSRPHRSLLAGANLTRANLTRALFSREQIRVAKVRGAIGLERH